MEKVSRGEQSGVMKATNSPTGSNDLHLFLILNCISHHRSTTKMTSGIPGATNS